MDELLEKAAVVKKEQRKADVDELKKATETIRKHSGLPPRDEKGANAKTENSQFWNKQERKDAPPYKVRWRCFSLVKH